MTVDNLIRGYTVGLFTQEPELDENKTVREIVEEGVQEVARLSLFEGVESWKSLKGTVPFLFPCKSMTQIPLFS